MRNLSEPAPRYVEDTIESGISRHYPRIRLIKAKRAKASDAKPRVLVSSAAFERHERPEDSRAADHKIVFDKKEAAMTGLIKRVLLPMGWALMLAWGTVQSQTMIRMEAEDMQLDTYKIENLSFASGGALINLKGPGFSGSASAPFAGISGVYDIVLVYHDENDGLAQISVSIDSAMVDTWTLDLKSDKSQPSPANRLMRQVATGYTVNTGDEIAIYGLQGNWDHANVDYIEFSTQDTGPLVTRIEVLDGYRVLGDPPYSTSWQTEVDIDAGVLDAAKSAHIGLYTIHSALGRLVVNGEVVQLPYVGLTNQYSRWRPELGQTLISIPLGYLRPGENTVRVESGIGNWTTENVYDDFEFGDVEIILSLR